MKITDGDLVIRPYQPEDRTDMQTLADNPNVSAMLADRFPHPYRMADADAWLAAVQTETRVCNFAILWRERFVGGIGLVPLKDIHSGTAELGYWLGEPFWGNGLAARAVALIVPYAFDELLFIRLQAEIFATNPRSMRVMEKSGFTLEGMLRKHIRKNGAVLDAALYAKLRNS